MSKFKVYTLLFFTLLINHLCYSQKIESIDFDYITYYKKIKIDFKISDLEPTLYNVKFIPSHYDQAHRTPFSNIITGSKISSLIPKSYEGELQNIGEGSYSIMWDPKKDGIYIDGKIHLKMILNKKINISIPKHLMKSIIYPGFGDYKLKNKKYYFLFGLAAYGFIGGAIYFNNQASINYNEYILNSDFEESQNFFNNYKENDLISKVFAFSSAFIWTVDLTSIIKRSNKVKKDKSQSDYYDSLNKKIYTFKSSTKYINTKEDYLIAYEKAEEFYLLKNYKKSKEYLNKIDHFKPSDEIESKKIKLMEKVNQELALMDNKYNLIIAEGKKLKKTAKSYEQKNNLKKALKQYKLSLQSFNQAKIIKSDYNLTNLIDIVKKSIIKTEIEISRLAFVEEGTQYFNSAEKFRLNKGFEDAKINFQQAFLKFRKADNLRKTTALTKKISITKSKIKFCNDNLKKGMKLLDDKFIEVYNKNDLKIEIKFSFGGCDMKANMYSYRYSGRIAYGKKYLNWKVDYTDCTGRNKVFGRGVEIGGNRLIKEIGSNPEDIMTEGFDDQFQGVIKSKIYDLKISNYLDKR